MWNEKKELKNKNKNQRTTLIKITTCSHCDGYNDRKETPRGWKMSGDYNSDFHYEKKKKLTELKNKVEFFFLLPFGFFLIFIYFFLFFFFFYFL